MKLNRVLNSKAIKHPNSEFMKWKNGHKKGEKISEIEAKLTEKRKWRLEHERTEISSGEGRDYRR